MSAGVIQVQPDVTETFYPVDIGRITAQRGLEGLHNFINDPKNRNVVECALRIRAVETTLYDLFGKGKLHGTIHTCIGQEFSGAVLGKYLQSGDFVTSNHRCHGHFIAATSNWKGLIDEIVGNQDGVCAGIGSSQHLWAKNFISNGQQGGLVPVAAGIALDRKEARGRDVVVSFIGEGTLGEGIVYETLNLDALWGLPHVIICENNFYSQSTPQERSIHGSIEERAAGFSVAVASADTWDLPSFDSLLADAIERARVNRQPTFLALRTYRLKTFVIGKRLTGFVLTTPRHSLFKTTNTTTPVILSTWLKPTTMSHCRSPNRSLRYPIILAISFRKRPLGNRHGVY
jgi:TPP-dependent pyruvate/acetoin dehydrogenase alpha subunit